MNFDSWPHDLRYAARRIVHQPGVSFVIVLTLGLGLGANTAVFSVMHSVLLQPLPYETPEQLVRIYSTDWDTPGEKQYVAAPPILDIRESAKTLEGLTFIENYSAKGVDITAGDRPERARMLRVSADYFDVLRISPVLGRGFVRAEESSDSNVAVVGEGIWERHMGGDRHALGETIELDGVAHSIVGVLSDDFEDPLEGKIDVWLPSDTERAAGYDWDNNYLSVVARLEPGATLSQVRAELGVFAERHRTLDDNAERRYLVFPLKEDVVGPVDALLTALMGAVGFLLLLTCVNVAGLLLAQTASRAHELALRTALGSTRMALVRPLVLESALLAVLGGVCGVWIGRAVLGGLLAIAPAAMSQRADVELSGEAVVLAAALAVFIGVAMGLAVALTHSRPDVERAVAGGSRAAGDAPPRHRLRNALVVSEVALAMVLLVGALVLARSFHRLLQVDLGIDAQSVTAFQINLPTSRYPDGVSRQRFYDEFHSRVRNMAGVESIGAASFLPASGSFNGWGTRRAHDVDRPFDTPNIQANQRVIHGDYFETLGIEILSGRNFDSRDGADVPRRVVVSESLVRRLFPDEDPRGKFLRVSGYYPQVIGVVEDVPVTARGDVVPKVYHRHVQFAERLWTLNQIVRTSPSFGDPLPRLRETLNSIDPELVLHAPRPMADVIGRGMEAERFAMILLGSFAFLGVLLSSLGLYGILAHAVVQRRREIGVRIALGARPSRIGRMVVRRGMALTLVGALAGAGLSLMLLGGLQSFVFELPVRDPTVVGVALVLFTVVSAMASYLPARRATRVDPVESFRAE